jgi:hypothetical protein
MNRCYFTSCLNTQPDVPRLPAAFHISCYEGSPFLFNDLVASEAVKGTLRKNLVSPSTEPDTLAVSRRTVHRQEDSILFFADLLPISISESC